MHWQLNEDELDRLHMDKKASHDKLCTVGFENMKKETWQQHGAYAHVLCRFWDCSHDVL